MNEVSGDSFAGSFNAKGGGQVRFTDTGISNKENILEVFDEAKWE